MGNFIIMDETNSSVPGTGMDTSNPSPANLPLTPAPQPRSGIVAIFLREDGSLRSGWSLVLYLIMCFALGYAFNLLGRRRHGHKLPQLWGFFVGEAVSIVIVVVPALVMARIEKRPFG